MRERKREIDGGKKSHLFDLVVRVTLYVNSCISSDFFVGVTLYGNTRSFFDFFVGVTLYSISKTYEGMRERKRVSVCVSTEK